MLYATQVVAGLLAMQFSGARAAPLEPLTTLTPTPGQLPPTEPGRIIFGPGPVKHARRDLSPAERQGLGGLEPLSIYRNPDLPPPQAEDKRSTDDSTQPPIHCVMHPPSQLLSCTLPTTSGAAKRDVTSAVLPPACFKSGAGMVCALSGAEKRSASDTFCNSDNPSVCNPAPGAQDPSEDEPCHSDNPAVCNAFRKRIATEGEPDPCKVYGYDSTECLISETAQKRAIGLDGCQDPKSRECRLAKAAAAVQKRVEGEGQPDPCVVYGEDSEACFGSRLAQ